MQFLNARTSVLQRTNSLPFNVSGSINAGTGMDVGSDGRLGIIATASYGNKWRTRANLQQASIALSEPAGKSFAHVMTDNQVTVNTSHARRVGKECVSTCIALWSPSHYKTHQ